MSQWKFSYDCTQLLRTKKTAKVLSKSLQIERFKKSKGDFVCTADAIQCFAQKTTKTTIIIGTRLVISTNFHNLKLSLRFASRHRLCLKRKFR